MEKSKVIIDTDPGTDDAWSILMALEAHRRGLIEIIAFTTVAGNTSIESCTDNLFRLLQVTGMQQIKVFSGSKDSLIGVNEELAAIRNGYYYHGKDGFGNVAREFPLASKSSILQKEFAPSALVRLVSQNEGKVVLVAIGPLTNIAKAVLFDPQFTKKLKDFYIMGGNTTGRGNITRCGEFNFFYDPEAAKIVLDNTTIPIKLVPYEVANENGIFTHEERRAFASSRTAVVKMMDRVEEHTLSKAEWETIDQIVMAWVIHEQGNPRNTEQNLCSQRLYSASVELSGRHTRGQMIIERRPRCQNGVKNVLIMESLDREVYIPYLLMGFKFGQDES